MRRGIAAALALGLLLPGCGKPSYPEAKLAESLVELCRREYGIEVKAQLIGTTLGCMAMIPGLIAELRNSAGENPLEMPPVLIEGRYEGERFDFRVLKRADFIPVDPQAKSKRGERSPKDPAPPLKKLQQVSTAMHRASLSTDAPLEFYRLIARDPEDPLDVVFSGHIMDSKRVQFYAISMGELQERSEFMARYQPERVARETVAGFLLDMRLRPLPQLLTRYTAPTQRFGDMLPKFLTVAVELKGNEEDFAGRDDLPVIQTDRETALVYLPLAEAEDPGALLFTVKLQDSGGAFSDIERLHGPELPDAWKQLGPPDTWDKKFYLEATSLPTFLAEQVAKRVAAGFLTYDPAAVPAEAEKKGKRKPRPEPGTMEDVTRLLAETSAYVMKSYEFKQFGEITVVDGLRGTRWVITASDLPLFQRKPPPELKAIP